MCYIYLLFVLLLLSFLLTSPSSDSFNITIAVSVLLFSVALSPPLSVWLLLRNLLLSVPLPPSGRQAPGAMNVVWGLLHCLAQQQPPAACYGVVGGLQGLIRQELVALRPESLQLYRNQGGVELLAT